MTNYVIRRTFFAILTLFGITILVYWMSTLAPGSPLDSLLADPGMTLAEVERRKAELGLDQPVYIQYFTWLKELLKGNWGYSYTTYRAVKDMVFERNIVVNCFCNRIILSDWHSAWPYFLTEIVFSTGLYEFYVGLYCKRCARLFPWNDLGICICHQAQVAAL